MFLMREIGSLGISSAVDGDEVTVIWTERGGPANGFRRAWSLHLK